jgi:hypothetical protein
MGGDDPIPADNRNGGEPVRLAPFVRWLLATGYWLLAAGYWLSERHSLAFCRITPIDQ